MSISHNTVQTVANAGFSAGAQTDARVAQLAGGGYVIAWTSSVPGDASGQNVQFRIFDSNGNPTGAPVSASAQPANNEVLQDIIANGDGSFSIAYTSQGAGGGAPSGYAAIGTLNKIGVVRTFNDTGTPQGAETRVGVAGAEEQVNSMKLQAVANGTVEVIFTQKDQATLAGSVYQSNTIATSGPNVLVASTLVKTYDGVSNPVPTVELKVLDTTQNNASSDFLLLTNRMIFTDNASSELAASALVSSVLKIGASQYLRLVNTSNQVDLSVELLTGSGNAAGVFSLTGNTVLTLDLGSLNNSGSVSDTQILDLGGGRYLLAWQANFTIPSAGISNGLAIEARNGVYGQVLNANSMTFEGEPGLLLEGSSTSFDAARLADGRIVVAGAQDLGFSGGVEVIQRIVDVSANGLSSSAYFQALNFSNDTAGVRVDLFNDVLNTGPAASFNGQLNGPNHYLHVVGGSGNDFLFGDANANELLGGAGDDVLDGRDSVDTLFGGAGDDTLEGGTGSDRLDGGADDDALHGEDGNDTLLGGDGDDALEGGNGDDNLSGGTGDDLLQGSDGDDTVQGDAGNDKLRGNEGDDILIGGAGNDIFTGGNGDDLMDGGDGNDLFDAADSPTPTSAGKNTINGGAGLDTVSYARSGSSGAGTLIDLSGAADPDLTFGFEDVDDIFINIENAIGTNGNDMILGTDVVNRLQGRNGDDIIYGARGADIMTGGTGADSFRFEFDNEGNDRIRDFTVGTDTIQIRSENFGDTTLANIGARFVANATGAVAANGDAQFTLDISGAGAGQLRYDADGNGAGAARLIALIDFSTAGGLAAFSASDFDFI